MKLFQQMLVAGASLSFIAPMAAQASNVVNLDEINSYARRGTKSSRIDSKTFINEVSEDIAKLKGRVDGLEVRQNEYEAGGFSDTTTMDGKAVFQIGAVEQAEGGLSESLQAAYTYQVNLNTSFTGDDNLYVRLKTGNASQFMDSKTYGTYLSSANGNNDALEVDKIWYSFPVGDNNTVWVGPKIENYYMHGTTPSIYKPVTKQFTLGGNAAAYGASTDSGAGWAYNADNGFAVSSNIVSKQNESTRGLLTNESRTSWATQVGFTQPQYAVSAIVNMKYNGWYDDYFSTANGITSRGHAGSTPAGNGTNLNSTNVGLRAWWRPEESGTATPEITLGYDTSKIDNAPAGADSTDAWFAGLTWKDMINADDRIGVAFGQPQTVENENVEPFAWEAYYSYKVNDSVSVTPAIFGGTDRNGTAGRDISGAVLETTFKF
ncbi:iron uptake porin [Prochlorococcus marinus]|uniref:iron uptake porin n=1 Tax=Prochlorococcus marinus TaxID=1219 RepID=UPI001AD9C78B|nr:iron uptake porin [Prochlorococcus marinus]MBO8204890.1 carbohydrate porin [Prochlorococcus marinus CUG1415]MBW3044163.1 porin [Prochlorococcus marinus str. MU1415]